MWKHRVLLALTKCFRLGVLGAMHPPPSGGRLCDFKIGFHASVLGSPLHAPDLYPGLHPLLPLLCEVQPIQYESPEGEVSPGSFAFSRFH